MSASFEYISSGSVDSKISASIRDEADKLSCQRNWTNCTPIKFYESDGDGKLFGSSKLGFTEEKADQGGDMRFIIDQLRTWSKQHGIEWEISMVGMPLGSIRAGEIDSPFFADSLIGLFDKLPRFESDQNE